MHRSFLNRSASRLDILLGSILALSASRPMSAQSTSEARASVSRVSRDIAILAGKDFAGRLAGTASYDRAADVVVAQSKMLGLIPGVPAYRQAFDVTFRAGISDVSQAQTENIIAILPGSDTTLRGQYIVIGAHLDHLGSRSDLSTDPDDAGVRPGADDNASGVAAVMELARRLSLKPVRRSVIFVAFGAEEEGLQGSRFFVRHAPVPLAQIVAMLNFDMVGRLRQQKLWILGSGTSAELPQVIARSNAAPHLHVIADPDGIGPSDQTSFIEARIPALQFFTGLHADYHAVGDIPSRVDAAGEVRVINLAESILRDLANDTRRPHFIDVERADSAHSQARPSVGILVGRATTDGLVVAAVRDGSPAAAAGIVAGDLMIRVDGKTIEDLGTYTRTLFAKNVGEIVTITIRHGRQTRTLRVRLTRAARA